VGAGLGAVLGTLCGDFVFMLAAVAGLAAVMQATPVLFAGLQWFGAAYLCWMGLRLLRANSAAGAATPEPRRTGWLCFRQAFAVSITNPKVMIFFVAFFPLFLRADSSAATLVAMMAHVTLLSFLYQAGLVLVGNAVARRLRAFPFARRLAQRLAGVALLAFGVKLAIGNR
jgi:threonine/homoserine/homoserine lactone efflux protein